MKNNFSDNLAALYIKNLKITTKNVFDAIPEQQFEAAIKLLPKVTSADGKFNNVKINSSKNIFI